MTKHSKVLTSTAPVPTNRDEARSQMRQIGDAQRERDRIQAELSKKVLKLKEQYSALVEPHLENIAHLKNNMWLWANANRATLNQGGKKAEDLGTGKLGWRNNPNKVMIFDDDSVLEALRSMGLSHLIRSKEDINKHAILANPDAVKHIQGIHITQGEHFWLKPEGCKLEKVA